ncbi:MAG: biotin--[acetyl-CoA-carboxylase] ligase [Verrucomicrobiae bacterium]|nr:biotin--[acetyl-CoA-carboxylase] ligase [Verrucomicrobiae bacterium]
MSTTDRPPPALPVARSGVGPCGRTSLPRVEAIDGWRVQHLDEVDSTNDVAAACDVWEAVRADRQRAGRGRHQRSWQSGAGGLWISAVVPIGALDRGWSALPLAAGLAVCETLEDHGVKGLRLRWPNDVLTGRRKLAGLLVDRFREDRAVIGVGINVANQPEAENPELAGTTVRLADLLTPAPPVEAVARRLLAGLRGVVEGMHREGFPALVPRINRWWDAGSALVVESDAGRTEGTFLGVDGEGRLRVRAPDGTVREWAAHEVRQVRDIENQEGHS